MDHQQQHDGDDALRRLQAMGERFMSMFDDEDAQKPRTAAKRRTPGSKAGRDGSSGGSAGTHQAPAAQPNKQQQQQQQQQAPPSKAKRKAPEKDAIEEVFAPVLPPPGKKRASSTGAAAQGVLPSSAASWHDRKMFMSSKVSKVHDAPASSSRPGGRGGGLDDEVDEDAAHLSPEEFQRLKLEVERLGASALDKKERKKWEAAMLQRLGAKAEKGPRMPAFMGKGIAAARQTREARQLEEAMQAGMVKRKGFSKKKKLDHERTRDRGLNELGRSFTAGKLRLDRGAIKKQGGGGGGGRGRGGNTGSTRAALNPVRGLGGTGRPGGKGKGKKGRRGSSLPFF